MFDRARNVAPAPQIKDLGCIFNISRRIYEEHETLSFCTQLPCLEYLSLLIENGLLLRTQRAGRVYAGFERLSRMEPVAERYLRIADLSERVYVFGIADWQPPRHPNLRVMPLAEGARLSRECFLIADSPIFKVALLARAGDEAVLAGGPASESRTFHVIKTSQSEVVTQLSAAAESLVDAALVSSAARSSPGQ